MSKPVLAALIIPLLSACVMVPTPAVTTAGTTYVCGDGAQIVAVYATDAGQDAVNLTFDGATLLLYAEPAASGVRYGWPSDGTNYVWWTKGDMADLYLKDGAKGGLETLVHGACAAQS